MAKKNYINVRPATDILHTEKGYEILLNLPGVEQENIKLQIHENQLILKAHMSLHQKAQEHLICLEFTDCKYITSFSLSDDVDKESLKAHYENGILLISFDYLEGKEPKLITVNK